MVASGVAAATLGGVGTANATCLSVSGINIFGSECTSSPLSFAFALGPNRAAIAEGLFTGAIAIGTDNVATAEGFLTGALAIGLVDSISQPLAPTAEAESAGALSFAYAGGTLANAVALGNLAIAATQGDDSVAFAGRTPTDIGNVALSIGNGTRVLVGRELGGGAHTPSYFNLGLNLGDDNVILTRGLGNSGINVGGEGNFLVSAGVVNNVTNFFGSGNVIAAVNQPAPDANILQQLGLNVVGTFFVDDKTVSSGPGPFEINIRTPFNSPPSSMTLTNASVRSGQEESGAQGGVVKQLLSFRPGGNAGPKATSVGGSGSSFKAVSGQINTSVKKFRETVNNVTRSLAERAKAGPAKTKSED